MYREREREASKTNAACRDARNGLKCLVLTAERRSSGCDVCFVLHVGSSRGRCVWLDAEHTAVSVSPLC